MNFGDVDKNHLSQINTDWIQVLQQGTGNSAAHLDGLGPLLAEYSGAVYRYLLKAVQDAHLADDLAQEFALRFVRGDFRNADPTRGRFRDYIKRALVNLITDHFRRENRNRATAMDPDAIEDSWLAELEEDFVHNWRRELLSRTWEQLANDSSGSSTHYAVLRLRAKYPDENSSDLAKRARDELGGERTAVWLRQTLRRARERFAVLLRAEVGRSLRTTKSEVVNEELAALGLLKYMK